MSVSITHSARLAEEVTTQELVARETSLLERIKSGDHRAFGELVTPHLQMLYRVASRTTRDVALAEDAVQEALVVAHRQLGRYRAGTSLRAYLAAIVVRRAHTLVRGEARRHQREGLSTPPGDAASAEEHVSVEQQRLRVVAALERLPVKRREAVVLRLEAGLSHAEIADALGSSERSVRVLVHLGLKELKQMLERDHD